MRYLTITFLQKLIIPPEKATKTLIKDAYRLKSYLNDTIVLKNNVIDVLNNRIIAADTIIKCPSYLLGSKATPIIRHRTTRFKSTYTKSRETSLLNRLINTLTTLNSLRANIEVIH
jgi:hypothetical protein